MKTLLRTLIMLWALFASLSVNQAQDGIVRLRTAQTPLAEQEVYVVRNVGNYNQQSIGRTDAKGCIEIPSRYYNQYGRPVILIGSASIIKGYTLPIAFSPDTIDIEFSNVVFKETPKYMALNDDYVNPQQQTQFWIERGYQLYYEWQSQDGASLSRTVTIEEPQTELVFGDRIQLYCAIDGVAVKNRPFGGLGTTDENGYLTIINDNPKRPILLTCKEEALDYNAKRLFNTEGNDIKDSILLYKQKIYTLLDGAEIDLHWGVQVLDAQLGKAGFYKQTNNFGYIECYMDARCSYKAVWSNFSDPFSVNRKSETITLSLFNYKAKVFANGKLKNSGTLWFYSKNQIEDPSSEGTTDYPIIFQPVSINSDGEVSAMFFPNQKAFLIRRNTLAEVEGVQNSLLIELKPQTGFDTIRLYETVIEVNRNGQPYPNAIVTLQTDKGFLENGFTNSQGQCRFWSGREGAYGVSVNYATHKSFEVCKTCDTLIKIDISTTRFVFNTQGLLQTEGLFGNAGSIKMGTELLDKTYDLLNVLVDSTVDNKAYYTRVSPEDQYIYFENRTTNSRSELFKDVENKTVVMNLVEPNLRLYVDSIFTEVSSYSIELFQKRNNTLTEIQSGAVFEGDYLYTNYNTPIGFPSAVAIHKEQEHRVDVYSLKILSSDSAFARFKISEYGKSTIVSVYHRQRLWLPAGTYEVNYNGETKTVQVGPNQAHEVWFYPPKIEILLSEPKGDPIKHRTFYVYKDEGGSEAEQVKSVFIPYSGHASIHLAEGTYFLATELNSGQHLLSRAFTVQEQHNDTLRMGLAKLSMNIEDVNGQRHPQQIVELMNSQGEPIFSYDPQLPVTPYLWVDQEYRIRVLGDFQGQNPVQNNGFHNYDYTFNYKTIAQDSVAVRIPYSTLFFKITNESGVFPDSVWHYLSNKQAFLFMRTQAGTMHHFGIDAQSPAENVFKIEGFPQGIPVEWELILSSEALDTWPYDLQRSIGVFETELFAESPETFTHVLAAKDQTRHDVTVSLKVNDKLVDKRTQLSIFDAYTSVLVQETFIEIGASNCHVSLTSGSYIFQLPMISMYYDVDAEHAKVEMDLKRFYISLKSTVDKAVTMKVTGRIGTQFKRSNETKEIFFPSINDSTTLRLNVVLDPFLQRNGVPLVETRFLPKGDDTLVFRLYPQVFAHYHNRVLKGSTQTFSLRAADFSTSQGETLPISDARKACQSYLLPQGNYDFHWNPEPDNNSVKTGQYRVTPNATDTVRLRTFDTYVKVTNASGEPREVDARVGYNYSFLNSAPKYVLPEGVNFSLYFENYSKDFSVHSIDTVRGVLPWYRRTIHVVDQSDSLPLHYAEVYVGDARHTTDHQGRITLTDVESPQILKINYPNYISAQHTLRFASSGTSTIGLKHHVEMPCKLRIKWVQDGVEKEQSSFVIKKIENDKTVENYSFTNTISLPKGDYQIDLDYTSLPFTLNKDTLITLNARTFYIQYSQANIQGEILFKYDNGDPKSNGQLLRIPNNLILIEGRYNYAFLSDHLTWENFTLDKDHTRLVLPVSTATFTLTEAGAPLLTNLKILVSGPVNRSYAYVPGTKLSVILPEGHYTYKTSPNSYSFSERFTVEKDKNTEVNMRLSQLKIKYSAATPYIESEISRRRSMNLIHSNGEQSDIPIGITAQGHLNNGSYVLEGYHYRRPCIINDANQDIKINYVRSSIHPITTRFKLTYQGLPIQSLKHRDALINIDTFNFQPLYVEGEPYELSVSYKGRNYNKPFNPKHNAIDTIWIPTNQVTFEIKSGVNVIANAEVVIHYDNQFIGVGQTDMSGRYVTECPIDGSYRFFVNAETYQTQELSWNNGSDDTLITVQLKSAKATVLALSTRDGKAEVYGQLIIRSKGLPMINKACKLNTPIDLNLPEGAYTAIWSDDKQQTFRKEFQIDDQPQTIPWIFNAVNVSAKGVSAKFNIDMYNLKDSSTLLDYYPLPQQGETFFIPDGRYLYMLSGSNILSNIDSITLKSDTAITVDFYPLNVKVTVDQEPVIGAVLTLRNGEEYVESKTDDLGRATCLGQKGTYKYSVNLQSLMLTKNGQVTLDKPVNVDVDFNSSEPLTPYLLKFKTPSNQPIADASVMVNTAAGDLIGSYPLGPKSQQLLELPQGNYLYNFEYKAYPFVYAGKFTVADMADSLVTTVATAQTLYVVSVDRDSNLIPCSLVISACKGQMGFIEKSIPAGERPQILLSAGNYPFTAAHTNGEILRDTIRIGSHNDTLKLRWNVVPYYDLSIKTQVGSQTLIAVDYRLRHKDSVQAINGQITNGNLIKNLASGIYYLELSKRYFKTQYDTITLRSTQALTYALSPMILNNTVLSDTLCPDSPTLGITLSGSLSEAADPLTYLWQKAQTESGVWTDLTATQHYVLTATDVDTDLFRRIAKTSWVSDTSKIARIYRVTVSKHVIIPEHQIISHKNSPELLQGHAQFVISNDRVSTYSWYVRTPSVDSVWAPIAGATGATYQAGAMRVSQDFKRQIQTVQNCTFASTAASVHVRDSLIVILPTVAIPTVSDITDTSAAFAASVGDNGGAAITEVGFYYSTQANPNFSTMSPMRADYNSDQTFSLNVKSLSPGTIYYVWSYAINSEGRKISESRQFTTTNTVGVQPEIENFVSLSPNPNQGLIRVDYQGYTLRRISIRTVEGKEVMSLGLSALGASGFAIPHSLKAGMYVLVIDTEQGPLLRKLNVIR